MQKKLESKSIVSLLSGIVLVDPDLDLEVHGISMDSRQVKPGDLFIAYPGEENDGRHFIQQATQSGAVAILAEDVADGFVLEKPVTKNRALFLVKNVREKISQIAARFYGHPSRQMNITGVTGTNGKTSIAYLLAYAFRNNQCNNSVYFGTLGVGFPDALKESTHTTLDPIHLQENLSDYQKQAVTHATLEVSSHALAQGRVAQIEFDTAVFTNLTHDHLDYHITMEAYGEAKAKLFKQFGLNSAGINWDDAFGASLYESLDASILKMGYSLQNPTADIFADNIIYSFQGIQANIRTPWGEGVLKTPLIGRFNVYNILAVVGVLGLFYPLKAVLKIIEQLPHVPGRMQCLSKENKPLFVIDYAHTPDALKNVLMTAKDLIQGTGGELWCVFGCGGDRDKTKRPVMGRVAEEYADHLLITNDNPRTEEPEVIAKDIFSGIKNRQNIKMILDREKAITYAYQQAKPRDIILIAGKGHESYQIIGAEKYFFSDETVCMKLLE
jgi:UDP-N-acetylmuramoyl-L-alanyl-D-glutamate--2,6-diaminopimelate ligase